MKAPQNHKKHSIGYNILFPALMGISYLILSLGTGSSNPLKWNDILTKERKQRTELRQKIETEYDTNKNGQLDLEEKVFLYKSIGAENKIEFSDLNNSELELANKRFEERK